MHLKLTAKAESQTVAAFSVQFLAHQNVPIFKMFSAFSLLEYELRGFNWIPQPRDILGAFGSLQRFEHDGHLKKSQAPEKKTTPETSYGDLKPFIVFLFLSLYALQRALDH